MEGIFKRRGNRISYHLADSTPTQQTGESKKYSDDRTFFLWMLLLFHKKVMDIVSGAASVTSVQRVFFFVKLSKRSFYKSGGGA